MRNIYTLSLTILLLLVLTQNTTAANRYWVTAVSGNWSNSSNWSTSNGGLGGAPVPTATDVAIFNANGLGDCNVDIPVSIGGLTVNGYLSIIDLLGFSFSTSGTTTLATGTINDTPGTSVFTVNSGGTTVFSGTTFGAKVNATSLSLRFNGSTFNAASTFTKNGTVNNTSSGGNTFNSTVSIINNGTGILYFADSNPDIFNSDVTLIVSNTGRLYLADRAIGNVFNGNIFLNYISNTNIYIGNRSGTSSLANTKTISVIGFGASGTGNLYLEEFTQLGATAQGLALNGTGIISLGPNSTFNADISTSSPGLLIRQSTFNGIANFNKTGVSGNTSYGGNTYNGATTITNSGSNYLRLAGTLGNTYHSTITFSSIGSNVLEPSRVGNSTFNENIFFNSTGTSNGIRIGNSGGSATLVATKTVNIGGSGFSSGELRFRNFIQTGNTSQTLTLTGTALLQNYDANWGGDVTFIAPRNNTRGTLYNETSYLEKTGASNDQSVGGNTFTKDVDFLNSGTGDLRLGNGTLDTYSANVTVTNTGSKNIYFANDGPGHVITGNLTTTNSSTGNAYIYIGFSSTSTLVINGNVSLMQNGNGTSLSTYFGEQGNIIVNGTLQVHNSGTGTTSDMRIANNTFSAVTVAGPTIITNNNTATTENRVYVGSQGSITFNGTLDLINNAGVANSDIYCNHNSTSNNIYNQNITVQTTSTTSDGIRFGEADGTGTLAATKTITIGGGGFIAGELQFRNFIQTGTTPQNLTLTGTGLIQYRDGCIFNGNLTSISPRLLTNGGTFNGITSLTKNGAGTDNSTGGSTFNNTTTITNSGPNKFAMTNDISLIDDFNADVTFIRSGAGAIEIARTGIATFAANVNINSASIISFGQGGGTAKFDGSVTQNIQDLLGTSAIPDFYNLEMDNSVSDLNINMPIRVITTLTLSNGNINSTTTNLITMSNNATIGAVSNASYINGPLEKIGNDIFTFPVGNNSFYRPISMTAPSNTSHAFRAQYFENNPHPTYDTTLRDPSLDHISGCEYWILDRTNGTSNVTVTPSWDVNSCGVTNLSELVVARWDGTMWKDHGNGGTTGNLTSGSVSTNGTVSSFSPFTLASITASNPLPVEIIAFNVVLNGDNVNLDWMTASEINNDYFTIEKSKDARSWESLNKQTGAGNSKTTLKYNAIDETPFQGVTYYRLKQTDFNGDFEYSNIISVSYSKNNLNVYPNPIKNVLNLSNLNANDIIKVYGVNGQLIFQGNTNRINTSNWISGIYEVFIISSSGEYSSKHRIVK